MNLHHLKFLPVLMFSVSTLDLPAAKGNTDESRAGDHPLPDPLKMEDGTAVATAEDWKLKRRPEVVALFQRHVYGVPPDLPKLRARYADLVPVKPNALEGLATRRIIEITFPDYPQFAGIELMIYLPNDISQPVPVFVGLSFAANHALSAESDIPLSTRWMRDNPEAGVVDHRATEANRGKGASRWPIRDILNAGFALATAYYGDIEPDHIDGWKEGIRGAIKGENAAWKEGEWGAIGAWSFGLSRILDCLETQSEVDASRCIVLGHSRLGKAALWAGAQDERFAITISNNSGEGGASLRYRDFGETPAAITKMFPHWFTKTYLRYTADPTTCPVDQHQLIALMAPRPVYVASATEDLWADPKGEFLAAKNAEPVYALFEKGGLGVVEQPPPDTPVGDVIGYHLRTGAHAIEPEDWANYIKFAQRHLRKN